MRLPKLPNSLWAAATGDEISFENARGLIITFSRLRSEKTEQASGAGDIPEPNDQSDNPLDD